MYNIVYCQFLNSTNVCFFRNSDDDDDDDGVFINTTLKFQFPNLEPPLKSGGAYIKYKNRYYKVRTGKRGGKYIMKNGKKIYM